MNTRMKRVRNKKGVWARKMKIFVFAVILVLLAAVLMSCSLTDPDEKTLFSINDNAFNNTLKNNASKDDAISNVTNGITNLREFLDSETVATSGYYMGVDFNIDTVDPITLQGWNFSLRVQAHLFTYKYIDDDGNRIYKWYDTKDRNYYDQAECNIQGHGNCRRVLTDAEDIHNEVIKKSDILIEWYDGADNTMLIGLYYDGVNSNKADPGNILYVNIQNYRRSFLDFGDTVLYRQMIRLLTSLSVEGLLTSAGLGGDGGTGMIGDLFSTIITENYHVVLNDAGENAFSKGAKLTSTLFDQIDARLIAPELTSMVKGIFSVFENKLDPLTNKYLGFRFSEVGNAAINTVTTDMQFFTQPDQTGNESKKLLTGAYFTFWGNANGSNQTKTLFNYWSDVSFEYGLYPPSPIKLDRENYKVYDYGKYEFTGNLYVPMLNANFDALIRTDFQRYDNSTNNVFAEFRDKANGQLMIGIYYKNERSYIDISGLEYLYGWIDLNQLGFPKVYDGSLNLAEVVGAVHDFFNDMIVAIVDSILDPNTPDKESKLLEELMKKTRMTEKILGDVFSKNTETFHLDIDIVKKTLFETGNGTYTTRQLIDLIDSMMPYTMDQIAIMLGVSSAEVMVDNSYFEITLNVDTNEITIEMFTNVGVGLDDPSILIFRLDLLPKKVGEPVTIAEVNFDGFKPLDQIYTYSGTMDGSFVFSAQETVDLSKLLSATIGENSGLNTPYVLSQKAGLSFQLIYDQFVTDQKIDGVWRYAGRSAFQLNVWLTGFETSVIIRLASDDVAFNNEVYNNQPKRAAELGWVWVSIECVKDNNIQRIPKIKVREDVFMSSMQAYMDGTSISDDASKLGESDVNINLTSILFALLEDSYVVPEPEQLEITTSNETVQSLFRVRGLIGNIRVNAGFRYRVEGLESVKNSYGKYQVGDFSYITGDNPYNTALHGDIDIYIYDDYHDYSVRCEVCQGTGDDENIQTGVDSEGNPIYAKCSACGGAGWFPGGAAGKYSFLDYDLRVDRGTTYFDDRGIVVNQAGWIQVFEKGAKMTLTREPITPVGFFAAESTTNQDISRVRFKLETLTSLGLVFIEDGRYYYYNYVDEKTEINSQYVYGTEETGIFIYWSGIMERIHHDSGDSYYFFDMNMALRDAYGQYIYIAPTQKLDFLFEHDEESIEITAAAKTQYAPRINGSFMGEVRRYFIVFTSPYDIERGRLLRLFYNEYNYDGTENTDWYYNDADKYNEIKQYDENGAEISSEIVPIVLFVFEPAKPLATSTSVRIATGTGAQYTENNNLLLSANFLIDWDEITLKGAMVLTDVIIAEGMMGEKTFPVRIIVTNREITPLDNTYVGVYLTENEDSRVEGVPVVSSIEIDPYDYMLAKYEYMLEKFNPVQHAAEATYEEEFKAMEREFMVSYFEKFSFRISFNYFASNLYRDGVDDKYIAKEYYYEFNPYVDRYIWAFDEFSDGTNTEVKITPLGGNIYLHTEFAGQLIALQVTIAKRTFSHVLFGEDDTFDPDEANANRTGAEIYGHYTANYFDQSSYMIPTNPIFVFIDAHGNEVRKYFDMNIISSFGSALAPYGLEWGNPEITNIGSNGTRYNDPVDGEVNRPFYISNVIRDSDGNIISEELPTPTENDTDLDTAVLNLFWLFRIHRNVNAGIYINVNYLAVNDLARFESGSYQYRNTATGAWTNMTVTQSSQNAMELSGLRYIKADFLIARGLLFKRNNGEYYFIKSGLQETVLDAAVKEIKGSINIISGTAEDNGFPLILLRISVECPKLDVAIATNSLGQPVVVSDESDPSFSYPTFTPSKIKTNASSEGYYFIDPLNAATLEIPTSITIYFTDPDRPNVFASHVFNNVEWFAYIDASGNGLIRNGTGADAGTTFYPNRSGIEVLRRVNGKTYFNLSTADDNVTTVRIMARIGSDVSGYEIITLCVRVLSKDPQHVDFYTRNGGQGLITSIERTGVLLGADSGKAEEFAVYSYYVNTFDNNFIMPVSLRAHFGSFNGVTYERSEIYNNLRWEKVSASTMPAYAPNSVLNLRTKISSAGSEVEIYIYLTVIVANTDVNVISTRNDLEGYYVKVVDSNLDNPEFAVLNSLLQVDKSLMRIGLWYGTPTLALKNIYVSTGTLLSEEPSLQELKIRALDDGVEMGKIGLYRNDGGIYTLVYELYPYEFLERFFSTVNITFNPANPVTNFPIYNYSITVNDGPSMLNNIALSDIAEVKYNYDELTGRDRVEVKYSYEYFGSTYYPYIQPNGKILLTPIGGGLSVEYELHEITNMIIRLYQSENIRIEEVAYYTASDNTDVYVSAGKTFADMFTYVANTDVLNFRDPDNITVLLSSFKSITLSSGRVIDFNEATYLARYLSKHEIAGGTTYPISGKAIEIYNFEGLFSVNDFIFDRTASSWTHSENYKIRLGAGAGAYDLTLRMRLDGGLRLRDSDAAVSSVQVVPYATNGTANYNSGYIFSTSVSARLTALRQNGTAINSITKEYGIIYGLSNPRFDKWYVEYSTFASLTAGQFITAIPQSIVYSTSAGFLTLSALTPEGYRIRREFHFEGMPSVVSLFSSGITTGLPIENGIINITDLYNYAPIETNLSGITNIPRDVTAKLNESLTVAVRSIAWNIDSIWATFLSTMTYSGTRGETMVMARAQVLGWEGYNDSGVFGIHDRITLELQIRISNAEISELPWLTSALRLDTVTLQESGEGGMHKVYTVDVDAFNDLASPALSGGYFVLPTDFTGKYSNGIVHTFRNVSFRLQNYTISRIPYTLTGIDIYNIVPVGEQVPLNPVLFNLDPYKIDLTVNLGAGQTITVRFRFYDKTVKSTSPVISVGDTAIRNAILNTLNDVRKAEATGILDEINFTRVQLNVENLISVANILRGQTTRPTSQTMYNLSAFNVNTNIGESVDQTAARGQIEALLLEGIYYFASTASAPLTDKSVLDFDQLYNFVRNRLRLRAEALVSAYVTTIYNLRMGVGTMETKISNIERQIADFNRRLFNDGFDLIIGDYLRLEMEYIIRTELLALSANDFSNGIRYKNAVEASFDTEAVIRAIYRIREKVSCGLLTAVEGEAAYVKIIEDAIESALKAAKTLVTASSSVYNMVEKIMKIHLGYAGIPTSQYQNTLSLSQFATANQTTNISDLRRRLNSLISEALDLSVYNGVGLSQEMVGIVSDLAKDMVSGIVQFSGTVTAIRNNLASGVNIYEMLSAAFVHSVNAYIDTFYSEYLAVNEIKALQKINHADGYYVVDPYRYYLDLPVRYVLDFDSVRGGHSYFLGSVNWSNTYDIKSITYKGNGKNDAYGYVDAWLNIVEEYASNTGATNWLSGIIFSISIAGLSWSEIKANNAHDATETATLNEIETKITAMYFNDVTPENIRTAYYYYTAGKILAASSDDALNSNGGISRARFDYFFDGAKYRLLTASVAHTKLGETVAIETVAKIIDKTALDIVVFYDGLTDNGGIEINVRKVVVRNPFTYDILVNDLHYLMGVDLPRRAKVTYASGVEYHDIVWSNIQITPMGNLDNTNHTLHGYIKSERGEQVQIELYVDRWQFAGIRLSANDLAMNPINFYFNEALTYSARDSYEVYFTVYSLSGGDKVSRSEHMTFYPSNSRLLVYDEDDSRMHEVKARMQFIISFDQTAVDRVIDGKLTNGLLNQQFSLGNAKLKWHNISTLLTGAPATVPKYAAYYYERLSIGEINLIDADPAAAAAYGIESLMYGLKSQATVVTDVDSSLPMTGGIRLYENNINYNPDEINVRYLWNKTYEKALSDLVSFVRAVYPDLEQTAVESFALTILMATDRTDHTELINLAKDYFINTVYYNSPSYKNDTARVERDAKDLLMIDEKYNQAIKLSGGATASYPLTVLIRIGKNPLVFVSTFSVRVVFSDYLPIRYYANPTVGSTNDIKSMRADNKLTELYIATRTVFFDSNGSRYEQTGKASPYDNFTDSLYRLLNYHNAMKVSAGGYTMTVNITTVSGGTVPQILYLTKVTEIEWLAEENGMFKSKSFVMNGVKYSSNLLVLPSA